MDAQTIFEYEYKEPPPDPDLNANFNTSNFMMSVAHKNQHGEQVEINYPLDPTPTLQSKRPIDPNAEINGPIPVQATGSRSIEIFFGKFSTFQTFYKALCDHGVTAPNEVQPDPSTKVKPESIRKLVLVGHPITSFSGLNKFVKLAEAWITHCNIPVNTPIYSIFGLPEEYRHATDFHI